MLLPHAPRMFNVWRYSLELAALLVHSASWLILADSLKWMDVLLKRTPSHCKDELEIERVLETSGTIVAGMLCAGMLCIHLLSGAVFMMTS